MNSMLLTLSSRIHNLKRPSQKGEVSKKNIIATTIEKTGSEMFAINNRVQICVPGKEKTMQVMKKSIFSPWTTVL